MMMGQMTDETKNQSNFDSMLYWLHLCKWIQCVTISISSQAFVYSSNILPVFYLHSYVSFLFFLPTKTRKNSTKFIEWVVSLVWISFPCQHIRLMFYWYSEYCQCPQTMKKIKTNIEIYISFFVQNSFIIYNLIAFWTSQ